MNWGSQFKGQHNFTSTVETLDLSLGLHWWDDSIFQVKGQRNFKFLECDRERV